ncbi:MAG TPA: PIG-L family deacetylase [Gemmatimonadaceae bacterium]|nr:PIG-L family deacetylase [Gemmatimonadaceae bacterium]
MTLAKIVLAAATLASVPTAGAQQPIGAVALGDLVEGLGVSARVLVIGAHPDDEDTYLISWLTRGRHVETAYLSLTRGEGGQNLIGNELGYALGQIRTEELLAARRVDGGRQFFTRAVDFGFSKSLEETAARWPEELILRDVVAVIRSFRPHVIVSIWTGTEADGHGHHQYSGVIAKRAFESSGDSARFRGVSGMPGPWEAAKLYRIARVRGGFSVTPNRGDTPGHVKINVGEYDPRFGRSYAEIAAQSRSQHLSQGMGMVLPLGTLWDGLTLDTSRVGLTRANDSSLFAGLDTSWARFSAGATPRLQALLDSMQSAIADAKQLDPVKSSPLTGPLSRVVRLARSAHPHAREDLASSLLTTRMRAEEALLLAAGVKVVALSAREKVAVRDSVDVTVSVYNRGGEPVAVWDGRAVVADSVTPFGLRERITVMPDSVLRLGGRVQMPAVTYPWWMVYGVHDEYAVYDLQDDSTGRRRTLPRELVLGDDRVQNAVAQVNLRIGEADVVAVAPVVYRFADPARGERRHPMVGVPRITTVFQSAVEYVRANRPLDRGFRVEVTSAWSKPDTVDVQLGLPPGLRADSAARRVILPPFGKASVFFRVRGTVKEDAYKIFARAVNRSGFYQQGFIDVLYDHINPVRYYQPPEIYLSAVALNVPANLQVAYLRGVGDNVQQKLEQLDVPVKSIAVEALPALDPRAYSTLVIGPRAFEANEGLGAASALIQDYARRGGTVVVQYQQTANRPGVLPFPVTFATPSVDRVTDENATVTFLDPGHRVVRAPNRITGEDFLKWGQERALYMPRAFDPRWQPIFEMHDPGEPPNRGAVLVAPLGKGTFVYTSLSFFRQLPGGHPGAARLFVNLLSAGLRTTP